jgi:hypothetical protein
VFNSSIVVLTGAGASIPVGIPGMVAMVRAFKDSLSRSDPVRRSYQEIVAAGVPDDLEEVLQFCNRLTELEASQIRAILQDAAAPRGGSALATFERRLDEKIGEARELRSSLIRWIGEVCLRFNREDAISIYADILPLIAQLQIPVFTTNYDGVFDYVAETLKMPVADNFKINDRGRRFWDPTHESFSNAGLKLIKMHGSIYWHATAGNVSIEKLIQPAPLNAEGEAVTQLLIFPTRFKDIYQQNYFPLYTAFTRTLGNASILVLIGHSLRDEYLHAAVRERLKDPEFALIVIDTHLPAAVRTMEGKVLHLDGGIKKNVPLLTRAIAEHQTDGQFYAYLSEARVAVKRGRKERIGVRGVPSWTRPGGTIDAHITVSTLLGIYSWAVSIVRGGKHERLFSSSPQDRISGYGEVTKKVRVRMPADLDPDIAHTLVFELFNETGRAVARNRKKVRVRKRA